MKKTDIALLTLVALLIVSLALFLNSTYSPGSDEVSLQPATTESSVSIGSVVSFTPSSALQDGIHFGDVEGSNLPVSDLEATDNDDGSGATSLYIQRTSETNVDLQVCIRGNANLTEVLGDEIPLVNETYWTDVSPTTGVPADSLSLNQSITLIPINLTDTSDTMYFKFWLDIPQSDLSAGTYNNTIDFIVVEAGQPCV